MPTNDKEVLELANNILKDNGYPVNGKELDLVIQTLVVGTGIGVLDSELTQKILSLDSGKPQVYLI
jgi:hypothetical protein